MGLEPYLVITSDAHAGLPTEQYRPYLDKKYHRQFDEFLSQYDLHMEEISRLGVRNEQFAKQWFDENDEGLAGGWDAVKRDQVMDADGICAEIVFPDADAVDSKTMAPFGVGLGLSGDIDPELGMAGAQAHNRWLAELCAQSPERRCGMALLPITAPVEDVVAEIRRAKESGLNGVMIPAMWVNEAPYHDRKYDPIWATLEELKMPIATHSGSTPKEEYGEILGIYVAEVVWWPYRPLWFLLWSGVFERFPGLRFGVVESGIWQVPGWLWFWDRLYMGQKGAEKMGANPFGAAGLTMSPSEYFDRNCWLGSSNTKRRELGFRYEIGVDNILWGSDFPHPEGTWPKTREWMSNAFHDIPIDETRRMLGLAAAEVFNFDVEALRPLADKIGPTPEDLGQLKGSKDGSDLVEKWAKTKAVGRHWLTGHDFALLD